MSLPTNDRAELLAGPCNVLCPECGVSECINPFHQPWTCVCGHSRGQHKMDLWWPMPAGYYHPHSCRYCDCEALRYATLEDAVREEREIEQSLRGAESE